MARVKSNLRKIYKERPKKKDGITKPSQMATKKTQKIIVDVTDDSISVIDAVDSALFKAGLPPSLKEWEIVVKTEK